MTVRTARALAGYRWRHFFPKAPNLNMAIPYYISKAGSTKAVESFRIDYVADGSDTYALQPHINITDFVNGVKVYYDGVEQDNPWDLLRYEWDEEGDIRPIYGYIRYQLVGRSIVFQTVSTGRHFTSPPPAGTNVRIDITNELDDNKFVRLEMKEYLIQGAHPTDPNLISPDGGPTPPQFQGGYRCTLHLSLIHI